MTTPVRPFLAALLAAAGLMLAACSAPPPAAPPGDIPIPPSGKESYVGLSKGAAAAKAAAERKRWRVVREDGRSFPVTMDYRPDRLNFTIRGGRVVGVTRG
ncbi:MAG: hypothetical protein HKN82_13210 [Akkermansiaceae bacterium]|nr:hypothetical protein [Akkermansiaceae bacterium]NNM30085.1 hypothetical protein [Akkermansiaceae bacterium]